MSAVIPWSIMKLALRTFLGLAAAVTFCGTVCGEGKEFQITKITPSFISSPQFAFTGAQQYVSDQRDRWLEVDATLTAAPEFSDELTMKYFILFNGKLLTGEVAHVNIPAGRENHSVMYVPPRTLQRLMQGRPVSNAALQNVAVQVLTLGAIKDELSLQRAPAGWYATLPQIGGLVLNKNETPFSPLYWERYLQIKPTR